MAQGNEDCTDVAGSAFIAPCETDNVRVTSISAQLTSIPPQIFNPFWFGAFLFLPILFSLLEEEGSPWDEYFTPDFHSAVKSGCLPEMQFFLISPG